MQKVLTLQGGDNGGAFGVYSYWNDYFDVHIYLMNLVLKRQSLGVNQARD
jgi:hypothetical protein